MRIIKDNKCIDVLCNKCGESCTSTDNFNNICGLIETVVTGCWSSNFLKDLSKYQFSICEKCLTEIFSNFKIPVKVTKWDQFHPRFEIDYFDKYDKNEIDNFDHLNDEYFGEGNKFYQFKIGKWVIKKNNQEKGRIYSYSVGGTFWEDHKYDSENHEYNYRKENRRYQVGFKWFVNNIDTGQIRYEILGEDEIE